MWKLALLAFDPTSMKAEAAQSDVTVTTSELPNGKSRTVEY